jgi:tetratricopeptide (TPR) repeat protein
MNDTTNMRPDKGMGESFEDLRGRFERRLTHRDTATVSLRLGLAVADRLAAEQKYLEADREYRKVIERNENSSLAHYRFGENLFRLHYYTSAAEEMYRTLEGDLEPHWTETCAHLTLGKIFDAIGLRELAIREYRLAVENEGKTRGAQSEARRYLKSVQPDIT